MSRLTVCSFLFFQYFLNTATTNRHFRVGVYLRSAYSAKRLTGFYHYSLSRIDKFYLPALRKSVLFPHIKRNDYSAELIYSPHNPSENQKVRPPKQAHKNANFDSRQTNQLQEGYPFTNKGKFAFYQIYPLFVMQKKMGIPYTKKSTLYLQYLIGLATLL